MSVAAVAREHEATEGRRRRPRRSRPALFEAPGPSLEDVVLDRWTKLQHEDAAPCLLCGDLGRGGSACKSCGSELR